MMPETQPHKWTQEQDAFIRENIQMDPAEISELLGVTISQFNRRVRKLGLGRKNLPTGYEWPDEHLTFLKENWEALTDKQLSDKLHISLWEIQKKRQELNLNRRVPDRSKHVLQQLDQILDENLGKFTIPEIAEKTGLPPYRLERRVRERHLSQLRDPSRHDEYIKTHYKTMSDQEMADALHTSLNLIRKRRRMFARKNPPWSDSEIRFLKQTMDQSVAWQSEQLGRTKSSVKNARKRILHGKLDVTQPDL